MPGALTHDPIRVGGGLYQNADGSVPTDQDGGSNMLSAALAAALVAGGYRCALAFDSMTDFNFTVAIASSVAYAGGVITATMGSAHLMPVGQKFNFWNRSYTSINAVQTLTVASVVSSTVFTATLNAGNYSDLAATLTGTSYVVPFNSKCSKSWLNWLNARGGQRVSIVRNDAQSGDTTTQFLARLPALIQAWRTDGISLVVGQMVGVNDITIDTITQTNNTDRIFTNLLSIFDMIRLAGFKMLVGTITPVLTGEPGRAQRSIMVLVTAMNNWLWQYAQRYADQITVIDGYPAIVDPTNTVGLARSGVLAAADKIHYSNAGGYAVAAAEQAKFNAALPVVRTTLPRSAADSQAQTILSSPTGVAASGVVTISAAGANIEQGQELFVRGATGAYTPLNGRQVSSNSGGGSFTIACAVPDGAVAGTLVISPSRQLMPDPLMLTTGGTAPSGGITGSTGDVPGQWNARGVAGTVTGVASIVADSEGFGSASRITVTAATADARVGWAFKNSVGTLENKMVPGRTYVFEAKLVIGSSNWAQTPISEVQFELNIGANSTETWRFCDLNQYENVIPLIAAGAATETLHLKSAPITVPLGATFQSAQATIGLRWQAIQSAGTLTMDLSLPAFRDVTNDYPVA